LLASVGVCRLSSSVTLPEGGQAVGLPIPHGGPVVLRPVRATLCLITWTLGNDRHTSQTVGHCTAYFLRVKQWAYDTFPFTLAAIFSVLRGLLGSKLGGSEIDAAQICHKVR